MERGGNSGCQDKVRTPSQSPAPAQSPLLHPEPLSPNPIPEPAPPARALTPSCTSTPCPSLVKSWAAGERRLLVRHPALKAAPCQQQCRSFLPDGFLKLPPVAQATPRESTPRVASSPCSRCVSEPASAMGNEELWVQSVLEMPKRRDILAIVLIVLPWTLLITVWHQSTIAPLLAVHKDEGGDSRRDLAQGSDSKEYCLSDRDIVEVVRTEYVYTRPPPWSDTLPTIHIITPTYSRPVQKAELTRLANTLLHVPNLHWILVEDSQRRTPLVTRLLRDTGLNYTHLNVETPRNYKLRGDMRDPRIPRGTMQRNLALRWLRETFNKNSSQPGIVYFADDDNTYSLELFEEMRTTRKVSVWPVAFVGGLRYESPKVNAAGKVYGWKTVFDPHRPFAIDMAGFAVNLRLILQRSQAYFKLRGVKGGYQESSLLRELVTLNDLEPKAANCTKILVWHTRTEKPVLVNEGKKGFTDPNVEI
ncbi:Galactosylgalactosylxylosylprotein 3-beta-glucuronosyltransferase 1 [Chelonia mydas]|uniref:Galactosylgalactosylxylosylprotein 3-beta-glucuronosyltransferase n=3 Tax=Cheloniidae TaxID=8465 RepID=M7BLH9_CHEMY|nr:Galactosylgalactosylxylosylprotein 3-beta-glucuronosyltransferase 1 [Chelonia mydas]